MDRDTRLILEHAIADLQDIAGRLQDLVANTQGPLRRELLDIQARSEAAVRYHNHLLTRPKRAYPAAVAQRVGLAAFGTGEIGFVPPHFSSSSTQ